MLHTSPWGYFLLRFPVIIQAQGNLRQGICEQGHFLISLPKRTLKNLVGKCDGEQRTGIRPSGIIDFMWLYNLSCSSVYSARSANAKHRLCAVVYIAKNFCQKADTRRIMHACIPHDLRWGRYKYCPLLHLRPVEPQPHHRCYWLRSFCWIDHPAQGSRNFDVRRSFPSCIAGKWGIVNIFFGEESRSQTCSSSNPSRARLNLFVVCRAHPGTATLVSHSMLTTWRASLKVILCPGGTVLSSQESFLPKPRIPPLVILKLDCYRPVSPAALITKRAIWWKVVNEGISG